MSAVPATPEEGAGAGDVDAGAVADAARLAAEICGAGAALIGVFRGDRIDVITASGFDSGDVRVGEGTIERLCRSDGVLAVPALLREGAGRGLRISGSPPEFAVMALLSDGSGGPVGLLVVADARPRELPAEREEALRALTRLISAHLELRATVGRLEHAAAERRRYEQHLEDYQLRLERDLAEILERSMTDSLTGLRNRRALLERLDDEVRHVRRSGRPVAVVLLDVDGFKPYNDAYGHPAGDRVLCEIARLFRSRVRSSDVIARIGGDEFALVLPATDAEGGYVLAERLRRAVESAPWSDHPVTVSAGAAATADPDVDAEELLSAADRALYAAKACGRNRTRNAG